MAPEMKFEGECIGGPINGLYKSCAMPTMMVPVMPKMQVVGDFRDIPIVIEITNARYNFEHGYWMWVEG